MSISNLDQNSPLSKFSSSLFLLTAVKSKGQQIEREKGPYKYVGPLSLSPTSSSSSQVLGREGSLFFVEVGSNFPRQYPVTHSVPNAMKHEIDNLFFFFSSCSY